MNPASTVARGQAGKRRKRRNWSFLVTALLLGLLLVLLLLEVAFRLLWTLPPTLAEFGQVGMYVAGQDGSPMLLPGYRGRLQFGDGLASNVHVNASGMRGAELPARHAAQKRVLIVGDCLVFGCGVQDDETLPACVERGLNDAGLSFVVGNGGIPGFGSSHAVARMARLDASFAADAFLVCGSIGTDAIDDALPARTVYGGLMLTWPMSQLVQTSWRSRLAVHSRMALWLEGWVFTNKREWSPLTTAVPDAELFERMVALPPENQRLAGLFLDARDVQKRYAPAAKPVVPQVMGYLRESLQRAQAVAGLRPCVFVILPTAWHIDESKHVQTLTQWGLDPADYEVGLAQKRWAAVAAELGMPVLDATPILRVADAGKQPFLNDAGDFTPYGNELVGRWLALEVAKLLP
jgi:hypothetical protein